MEQLRFRAGSCHWSLAASWGDLLLETLSIPLTSCFFRGHRGLQASQAPLGSLQW